MNMFRFAARFLIAFVLATAVGIPASAQTASTYYTAPTVSALAAMTARPATVYVLGQAVATDLQGGLFNWVAGSSAAADGYDIVAPSGGGPAGRWFRQTIFTAVNSYFPSGGDDAAGLQSCIDKGSCLLRPGANYSAINLTVGAGQTLDCQGATITSRSSGSLAPIVTVTGRTPTLNNCQFSDLGGNTMRSTTLTGAASPGSATVAVASATGFAVGVGRLMSVALTSGAHWTTEISNVVGTTITLADAIPYSATAVAVAGGGSTCQVNDVLVVSGGITAYGGGPLTIKVTSVDGGGAVTGATIKAPGFYSTAPTNAVATTSPTSAHCTVLPTFNVTWGGASNGAAAMTAVGMVLVDATHYGTVSNVAALGPIGVQIQNTNGPSFNGTANMTIRGIRADTVMSALFVGPGVSNVIFDDVIAYGTSSLSLTGPGGHRGLYWTTRGGVPDTGSAANRFTSMLFQGYEIGGVMHTPFGAFFSNITFDTSGYYGASIDNAGVITMSNMSFYGTSPQYYTGANYEGVGLVLANTFLTNNLGATWGLQFNAASIWVADTNSTWLIPWNSMGPQTSLVGPGAATFRAAQATSISNGGTGTATTFTAGSVVFAGTGGVYSQDNGNLFWDDANNRLGVGTASPSSALDMGSGTITSPVLIRGSVTGSDAGTLNLTGGNAHAGGTGAAISLRGTSAGFNNGGIEFYYGSGGSTLAGATLSSTGVWTLNGALAYGGVTLSNSVTGTGSMALSASPTFTGTVNVANLTGSGTIRANTGFSANGAAGLSVTKTVRDSAGTGTCTLIFTMGLLTGGTC